MKDAINYELIFKALVSRYWIVFTLLMGEFKEKEPVALILIVMIGIHSFERLTLYIKAIFVIKNLYYDLLYSKCKIKGRGLINELILRV